LDRFDALILKNNFLKIKKHHFDTFQHEKHFKKQPQPHSQTSLCLTPLFISSLDGFDNGGPKGFCNCLLISFSSHSSFKSTLILHFLYCQRALLIKSSNTQVQKILAMSFNVNELI